jgi:hypothetical protein
VIGILCAQAVFLAAAGLAKLARPAPTVTALRAAGMPVAAGVVRAFALIEVTVAAAVVTGGRLTAALFAATFGVLAVVAARIAARRPGADCGCFGAVRAPASQWHTVVNAACAGTGLAGVFVDPPSFGTELARQPLLGVAFLAAIALLAWLLYMSVTALPELSRARAELVASR